MRTRQDAQSLTQNGLFQSRKRGQRLKKGARARLKARGLELAGHSLVIDICKELGISRRAWYAWLAHDAAFRQAHNAKIASFRLRPADMYLDDTVQLEQQLRTMSEGQIMRLAGCLSRRQTQHSATPKKAQLKVRG